MFSPQMPEEISYNEEVFRILLEYEVSRSRRYPTPVALLEMEAAPSAHISMPESAASLIFLKTLAKNLRSVDIPSGAGKTFKALLPTTDEEGARAVCERLLSVFQSPLPTAEGGSIAFTLRIGAAAHPGGASLSSEALLAKAAEALLEAKAKGARAYVILM